jgi:glyoxylase-like metal-dependent hydrolase (beta-lactamase superfamily II)
MIFLQIPIGGMKNFTYIIGDEKTGEAAVVDPHGEVDRIISLAGERNLKIRYVLNTHSHFDHVGGNEELAKKTGARIIAQVQAPTRKDIAVKDGETIKVGNLGIKVLHTPGHTPEAVCYLVDEKLLTGDTLFVGECGRTDLPGGNPAEMWDSLLNKLSKMEDSIEVYPGHDYGETPRSTIGREKQHNYTLKPRTREEFIAFMRSP